MRLLRLLLLISIVFIFNEQSCQAVVTNNIIERLLFIRQGSTVGSGFTIEVDGRQYLITARHILPASGAVSTLDIFVKGEWNTISVKSIPVLPDNIDIGVLAVSQLLTSTRPIRIPDGIVISDDVYFLGYPYGIVIDDKSINNGFPLPFVKHAIISAIDDFGSNQRIFLDGINNPGFSGGPVVHMGSDSVPEVIGVISGYRPEQRAVTQSGKATDLSVSTNTGIIVAYMLTNALRAIHQTPIGFPVPKR